MNLALLYSGGKDSSLAALLVKKFYDVRLITGSFGITDDWQHAAVAAERLGYPFETIELDRDVAETAVTTMLEDGYPRNGIQTVHEHALEVAAQLDVAAVADGTRRDDRVPTISRAKAQSLEDRNNVDYLSPLSGFGHHAVDQLTAERLSVNTGPSDEISKSDYETELRALIANRAGSDAVTSVFPAHTQSYVNHLRSSDDE
ncbi:PP-loop ATPase [Haloquadratum walsbyi]|uniref:Putative PP-loop ATPase n=1 Tax=Haloquadratum walsbyi J07HQW2 TaxID=1238425 RepID=U1PQR4_9EURY|nr:PP-loop ATPase [Haloquadratum walsbyi]ERG96107.1 MAG: putative PP-loop ATPase [Haloquadratum walsbyi J07HQW2]